jgi:hypothetical protein
MVLDRLADEFMAGQVPQAFNKLVETLAAERAEASERWPELARWYGDHPVRDLLLMDPFTYRAYSKPRGYAGDAVMMDYIYGLGEVGDAMRGTTSLGRAIFQHVMTCTSPRAVRYRRQVIAGLLDETARRPDPRVLAIAAGHLRELDLSTAAQERRFSEFVALDQDIASMSVVANDYGHLGITTKPGSVRQILAGKLALGQYDLVYAAGLYDYLNAATARALTRRMFDMTRPGGTVLIPNFLTGIADSGYMEAFMDWHLIYRNHEQMYDLVADIPTGALADLEVFNDPDDAIAYLVVRKAEVAPVN